MPQLLVAEVAKLRQHNSAAEVWRLRLPVAYFLGVALMAMAQSSLIYSLVHFERNLHEFDELRYARLECWL